MQLRGKVLKKPGLYLICLCFATLAYSHDPIVVQKTDEQMVEEIAPTLSKEKYLEVIDAVEEMGGIDHAYAQKLRRLINAWHWQHGAHGCD